MSLRDSDGQQRIRRPDPIERRYRNMFDTTSVGLLETDLSRVRAFLDGIDTQAREIETHLVAHPDQAAEAALLWSIRDSNTAALRLLGGCRRDELPASFGEILRGASQNAWIGLLTAVAQGASAFESEICLSRLDDDRHLFISVAIPRDDADLGHVVVSMLDITERKRLERELWTAQRMEAIGQLTGGVAHDFNNLLMVIGSYAGFVMDQLDQASPAREDVKVIQDAAARAAELTNQLLAFSSRQVQQLEILDLNVAAADLDRMLRRVLGEHIELRAALDPQLGLVKADRLQIEQVLMNLAVNARDAMPSGGDLTIATSNVRVDAAAARARGDGLPIGDYVVISVSDSGVGMDEATRARIFDPFFSTKERGRGTGLGLSTVYGIVKQSQGHICVQSEPSHGSTFEIFLPRVAETGTAAYTPALRSQPAGCETVLLVEDEQLVRLAARRILERHGYRVLEAQHGREALELCTRHEGAIDLMVTDVVMPQMNGRELARQLTGLRPTLKVIFVSGYADDVIAQYGPLDADMAFIQKPFSPDTLLRKVRDLLDPAS